MSFDQPTEPMSHGAYVAEVVFEQVVEREEFKPLLELINRMRKDGYKASYPVQYEAFNTWVEEQIWNAVDAEIEGTRV